MLLSARVYRPERLSVFGRQWMALRGYTSGESTHQLIDGDEGMKTLLAAAEAIEKDWRENPRWKNVRRDYTGSDVVRLKGSVQIEYTFARLGAEKLWRRVNTEDFVLPWVL